MNYKEMVENAKSSDRNIMWKSVEHISRFMIELDDVVPDMVRDFMVKEYENMYGGHFCEAMAREEVSKMHHIKDGIDIHGELVPLDEAKRIIPEGYNKSELLYDAYVGANGIAHDIDRACVTRDSMLEIAKEFWFNDDDFTKDKSKVWWYFSNK